MTSTTLGMRFRFRWPVIEISQTEIEVQVPLGGNGPAVLNTEFIKTHRLSEADRMAAEGAVLRAIAIIQ